MRVAIAQINPTLGDFLANRKKIQHFANQSILGDAELIVFPECALFGYPPKDTLESDLYVDRQLEQLSIIASEWEHSATLIIGLITRNESSRGKPFFNSAAIIENGKIRFVHKSLLPSYDVFDEARYVEASIDPMIPQKIGDQNVLVTICEDIWGWPIHGRSDYRVNPVEALESKDIDLIINISASPFSHNQGAERLAMAQQTVKHLQAPIVYVNAIGGQDELIFDGASFVLDDNGQYLARSSDFMEQLKIVDLNEPGTDGDSVIRKGTEATYHALVLGVRDFVGKTGLGRVHLGLSGGIDSAVVAAIAVDALPPGQVSLIALPTRFNSSLSFTLADELSKNLGASFSTVEIDSIYQQLVDTLSKPFELVEMSLTHENLQARIRGLVLMAYSNRYGSLLLTTGNKSEYATGFATLYGDMCGGLAPIADLLKSEVYAVAEYINQKKEIIPRGIIDRPPSAELRPDQTDEQSLPAYDELDAAVRRIVEERAVANSDVDKFVAEALFKTEFKRWQAPPVLRVSKHAFGRGRRLPIVNRFS